jgi:hypothetical protein
LKMPKKKITQRFKGLCRMSSKLLAMADIVVETDEIETCCVTVKKGRVELWLGPLFRDCKDDKARQHMLRHECFHVMLDHHGRQGERDIEVWNKVTDAAIHAGGAVDWQLIDKACDVETITYERLGIPTMPPEVAYDYLTGAGGTGPGPNPGPFPGTGEPMQSDEDCHTTCGRGPTESDTDDKSQSKEAEIVAEVLQSWEAEVEETGFDGNLAGLSNGVVNTDKSGVGHGSGRDRPEIYQVPSWVIEVLDRLLERHNAKLDRERTWTREHRYIESGLLPGQKRGKGWEGVWCIDASGSIDKEAVEQMIAAAVQTPELVGSMVAVFDDGLVHDELIPVHNVKAIQDAIGKAGGGTSITKSAKQIDKLAGEKVAKVWLTDAHSSDGLPKETDEEIWTLFTYKGVKVVDYPAGR